MSNPRKADAPARHSYAELQQRLEVAEQTLAAIGGGEVDAFVVETVHGKRIYTLQGADEPYRLMIERMHEGAATLTPDGSILYCNQRLASLLHRPLQKVIGSDLHRYLPEQGEKLAAMLRAAHDTDQRQEFDLHCDGGAHVPVQLSVSRISLDERVRLCAVVSDLTEQRQHQRLRESESHFRHIAQALPQIVWTAGPDGTVDSFNQRWTEYTGKPAEMSCQTEVWLEALHPDDRARSVSLWRQAVRDGGVFEAEQRLRHRDGGYRWHLSRGIPVRDARGRVEKWFGTTTDIEAQKQAEASLKDLAEILEQRVTERTALAEQRATQLRLAASELAQAEQRERRRIAQTLHDHLQQLLVAAKFKLSVSRNSVGQGHAAQPVLGDLDELLHDAIEASRDLAVDLSPPVLHERGLPDALHWLARRVGKQHDLVVGVNVRLYDNDEQLREPLRDFLFHSTRELLFNAVKHARCSRATVTLARRPEGDIELSVVDNGRGCDPEQIASREGTGGIGLSSMRQRAELWGGRLEIRSKPGQGCAMKLRLPPQAASASAIRPAEPSPPQTHHHGKPAPPSEPEGIRVLLADDHAILRDGLAGLLRQHGFTIVGEAADGQQAIDLAIALQPDVVLMDISMPQVSGIDATRMIRRQAPDIRVIGLSMHDDANVALALHQAGAVGFLTKGTPSDLLVQTIRDSLTDANQPPATPQD